MTLQQILTADVYPFLDGIITLIAGALFTAVLAQVKQHFKLQLTQAQGAKLDELVSKGIALAEEKAEALISKKLEGSELNSNAKLNLAVQFIATQAQALGLPAKADDAIEDLIHAKLGMTAGVGATGVLAIPGAAQ